MSNGTERRKKRVPKTRWFCDVCNVRAFDNLDDATRHEASCNGIVDVGPNEKCEIYIRAPVGMNIKTCPPVPESVSEPPSELEQKDASEPDFAADDDNSNHDYGTVEAETLQATSSISVASPPPQITEPALDDINEDDYDNLQLSDQIIVMMRQETLRHLESAWEAQRKLALLCAENGSPLLEG